MWKLIALVLAKMIWVKNVGGVTLKNSLVLLLWDPHHLDGNPWSCSCIWWSRTWCSLGDPLERGFRCFFKCINLFLKLVLAFVLVVLWWKIILCLCSLEGSRIILLLLGNKLCLWIFLFVPCGTNPCRYWKCNSLQRIASNDLHQHYASTSSTPTWSHHRQNPRLVHPS